MQRAACDRACRTACVSACTVLPCGRDRVFWIALIESYIQRRSIGEMLPVWKTHICKNLKWLHVVTRGYTDLTLNHDSHSRSVWACRSLLYGVDAHQADCGGDAPARQRSIAHGHRPGLKASQATELFTDLSFTPLQYSVLYKLLYNRVDRR